MTGLKSILILQAVAVQVTERVDWGVNIFHSDRIRTSICVGWICISERCI